MIPQYLDMDFDKIYPEPDNDQLAASFFNRLYQKIHMYNFSVLITYYGPHRVGKSLAAVSFSYILDPTFEENLEHRILYKSKQMLEAFSEVRKKNIKGAAFVIDEAGSSDVSSQRWYEEAAKIVSAELQSIGYLNPIIFFVTQDFSFINKTARKLSQGVFKVTRANNQYSEIKPFWISNDPWTSKTYRKYPVFCYERSDVPSNIYKINCIKLGLPPDDIRQRYDQHSQTFKDQLLEDGILEMTALEDSKASITNQYKSMKEVDKVVDLILKDPESYKGRRATHDKPILDHSLIQYGFKISYHNARIAKRIAEKKLREMDYVLESE
jgi:hypothetical protein